MIAPVALSATAGEAVYLLEWVQLPDGAWGAQIARREWSGLAWKGTSQQVMAKDLTPIEARTTGGCRDGG